MDDDRSSIVIVVQDAMPTQQGTGEDLQGFGCSLVLLDVVCDEPSGCAIGAFAAAEPMSSE